MPMTADEAKAFMLAGRSIFTTRSRRTGKSYTYKVTRQSENSPWWRVGVLSGPDNQSDYTYIGSVGWDASRYPTPSFFPPKDKAPAPSAGAFKWVLDAAFTAPESFAGQVEFLHEGRCGRCTRPLTDPESIISGFGPECRKRMGMG
jgi:hypothetical protein